MEHLDECPPVEKCLLIPATIVGPKPSDNNVNNFRCFTEGDMGSVRKVPDERQMKLLRKWRCDESPMLANQREERLEILNSFYNGVRQFLYSDYDRVERATFTINDIERRCI
jgi:hypothetical protein